MDGSHMDSSMHRMCNKDQGVSPWDLMGVLGREYLFINIYHQNPVDYSRKALNFRESWARRPTRCQGRDPQEFRDNQALRTSRLQRRRAATRTPQDASTHQSPVWGARRFLSSRVC